MLTLQPNLALTSSAQSGVVEVKNYMLNSAQLPINHDVSSLQASTAKGSDNTKILRVVEWINSPFIEAFLVDLEANTETQLTISGALAGDEMDSGRYNQLVYSSEQDKWYLKVADFEKIYPLTLSDTTLIIETPITYNIGGESSDQHMTGDGTDLFLLDVSTGDLRKYDLSAGTMGSAMTAPPVGYYTTDSEGSQLEYSNGKLYLISSPNVDVNGGINYIAEYDIASNSWASLAVPDEFKQYPAISSRLCCDPASSTYFYVFLAERYDLGYNKNQSILVKYDTANETCDVVSILDKAKYAKYLTSTNRSGLAFENSTDKILGTKGAFVDSTNGRIFFDIVNGDTGYYDFGTANARRTLIDYTGTGKFLGAKCSMIGSGGNFMIPMNVTLYVTIDGVDVHEYNISEFDSIDELLAISTPFSTSLKVEALYPYNTAGNSSLIGAPFVTLAVNYT